MKLLVLIKKELKYLLCNPIFLALISILNLMPIVALIIFLKINSFDGEFTAWILTVFSKATQLQSTYAGFENIVSLMIWIFALAIPAVSVISFFREKRSGADEFLRSIPISRTEIVLSKIFAQVIFFAIPTLIVAFCVIPFIFLNFYNTNLLNCFLSLLFLALFEVFVISLSVMLSTQTKKAVFAMISTYGILLISFIFGVIADNIRYLPFGTQFDKIFGSIFSGLSFFDKLESIIYELFDWTSLLFFVIGTVAFVSIALIVTKRKPMVTIISIVLIATIGIFPMLLPHNVRQIDITSEKLYTSSTASTEYFSSLEEKITIYLVDPYNNDKGVYVAIERMVEPYKNITLKTINSSEDKDILEKYGLSDKAEDYLSYAIIVEGENRWTVINDEDYFSCYNESLNEYLSLNEYQERCTICASILNQYQAQYESLGTSEQELILKYAEYFDILLNKTVVCLQLDDALTTAIDYVTTDIIPTVYFLSGHGEEVDNENAYDFKKNGILPKNADTVVINSPSIDFTEEEIDTLIDFTDAGGKLYVLMDVDNCAMPNFMSLLAHFGLSVENDVISADGKTNITASLNLDHEAFSESRTKSIEMINVSKITVAENQKYSYTPILYYGQRIDGEESAENAKSSVAVSVSQGKEKKISVFTGADTFNSKQTDLAEDEIERASGCISDVIIWMFDAFEADIIKTQPKKYQKTMYSADDLQIVEISITFCAIVLIITASITVYILARRLRSKRAIKKD